MDLEDHPGPNGDGMEDQSSTHNPGHLRKGGYALMQGSLAVHKSLGSSRLSAWGRMYA